MVLVRCQSIILYFIIQISFYVVTYNLTLVCFYIFFIVLLHEWNVLWLDAGLSWSLSKVLVLLSTELEPRPPISLERAYILLGHEGFAYYIIKIPN